MASCLLFSKDVCPSNFSVGLFYGNFFALPKRCRSIGQDNVSSQFLLDAAAPVKTVEKKISTAPESSIEKSSVNEENTSKEFGREDYPGLAFWVVLMGLYDFTYADFVTSLIGAIVAFGFVRGIV